MGIRVLRSLVFLAASAAVLAGCGGVEQEANLEQAAERTEAAGSSRIEIQGTGVESGGKFDCRGEANYTRRAVQFSCTEPTEGDFEMRAVDGIIYMKFSAEAFSDVVDGKWVKMPDDTGETSLSDFLPESLLTMLRSASSETERVGEEDVRGTSTVRYRLTVDCDQAELSCDGQTDVGVWIDDEGLVRRIEIEDDDEAGTIEFFDFGADVTVEAPPAEDVVSGDEILQAGSGFASGSKDFTCAEGDARPITQGQLVRTLRGHGFSMNDDGGACVVDNLGDDSEAALEREGHVFCGIHAEPPAGAPATVTRTGADGADAELALQNVSCTIFTDSPTGEEKIAKLEAAFDELERAIRP